MEMPLGDRRWDNVVLAEVFGLFSLQCAELSVAVALLVLADTRTICTRHIVEIAPLHLILETVLKISEAVTTNVNFFQHK